MAEFRPNSEPLLPAIAQRWSPRNFSPRAIPLSHLESLFEAARWTASCFNEQPWRFVIATQQQPDEFARLLRLLVPRNQEWAQNAFALGIGFAHRSFTYNGQPNRFGMHDAGAALTQMMIQASSLGFHVHGMAGFDAEAARLEFAVPEEFEVGAAFAIGYLDGANDPPPGRSRRPLMETVFTGAWNRPAFPS